MYQEAEEEDEGKEETIDIFDSLVADLGGAASDSGERDGRSSLTGKLFNTA